MKRRILFIGAAVIFLLIVFLLVASSGQKIIDESIQTTMIVNREFVRQYKTTGTVSSRIHSYYFIGNVTACDLQEGTYVTNGGLLLRYNNINNEAVDLRSSVNGFVKEIGGDRVTVADTSYYIVSQFTNDVIEQLAEGDQAIFHSNDTDYLMQISSISSYGRFMDDAVYYEVVFIPEEREKLKLNQQGNVTVSLKRYGAVPVVNRKAVMNDDKGSYLIRASWLKEAGDVDDYRIDVKVVAVNEELAYVSGIDIEGEEVCILSDELKKVIYDQAH